jgi:acyl-coenzyme A synthetase/AMP-(fatty) acid ligase
MVKIRGFRIEPDEVEAALAAHAGTLEAVVVAIPDEQWGENVGAAVVLKEGAAATADELQQWVKDRLRSSRVPAAIIFKDQLPYNEMGKILRRVVKQELTSPPAK